MRCQQVHLGAHIQLPDSACPSLYLTQKRNDCDCGVDVQNCTVFGESDANSPSGHQTPGLPLPDLPYRDSKASEPAAATDKSSSQPWIKFHLQLKAGSSVLSHTSVPTSNVLAGGEATTNVTATPASQPQTHLRPLCPSVTPSA